MTRHKRPAVTLLATARRHFCGIGTRRTKFALNKLSRTSTFAKALRLALEIEDQNLTAKTYHGGDIGGYTYDQISDIRKHAWHHGIGRGLRSAGLASRHSEVGDFRRNACCLLRIAKGRAGILALLAASRSRVADLRGRVGSTAELNVAKTREGHATASEGRTSERMRSQRCTRGSTASDLDRFQVRVGIDK